jgi:adenylate cyclase
MVHHDKAKISKTEIRKRVFVSHAKVLSDEQRQSLTEKEKAFEATCKDRGVRLELFCPDDACFTEEEHVQIPIFCEDPKVEKKLWLNLFCPGGSCEIDEATRLP